MTRLEQIKKSEVSPELDAAYKECIKMLKMVRKDWISDQDPEWPILKKIDKALAALKKTRDE